LIEDKKKHAYLITKFKWKTKCNHCHGKGHWEKECRKKNQDESKLKSEVNVTTTNDFQGESPSFLKNTTFVISTTFSKRSIRLKHG
jgi:DnaJ-class molecular chaperone